MDFINLVCAFLFSPMIYVVFDNNNASMKVKHIAFICAVIGFLLFAYIWS